MIWRTKFFLVSLLILQACGVSVRYSASGSTTEAQTLSVQEFYNNADLGPANLGQVFTNTLKNYLLQNSRLRSTTTDAELQLEGEIADFRVTPIAPVNTSDNITRASSSRLTITVKVTFVNTLDDNQSFNNRTFSFYQDFSNDQNLADVEEELSKKIFERIANDIFNATVANW